MSASGNYYTSNTSIKKLSMHYDSSDKEILENVHIFKTSKYKTNSFYFSNVWSLQMGDGAFWVKLLLIICSLDIKRFVVFFFLSYLLFLFVIFLVFYVFVSFNFAFYRVTQERLKILTRCSLQQNWKTRQLTVLLLWT